MGARAGCGRSATRGSARRFGSCILSQSRMDGADTGAEGVDVPLAFAARFRTLVGETPLEHLTQWRMARAASMMRDSRPVKLTAIAGAVGYESDSAFGKVFRRVMGISPGQYRRDQRVDGALGPNPHRPKTKTAAQGV